MPALAPDGPVLEVYYASTCAPCHAELGVLAAVERTGPDALAAKLVVYLLTDEAIARREVAAASPALAARAIALPADTDQRSMLRAAGDADGILPFARARDANGRVCASWRGMLTLARIKALLGACAISEPARRPSG